MKLKRPEHEMEAFGKTAAFHDVPETKWVRRVERADFEVGDEKWRAFP